LAEHVDLPVYFLSGKLHPLRMHLYPVGQLSANYCTARIRLNAVWLN